MKNRYYYLSNEEYSLLYLFDLTRFVEVIPCSYDFYLRDYVISYDNIDKLARVVFSRENKFGEDYQKLVCFVERLQDLLEINPDIC